MARRLPPLPSLRAFEAAARHLSFKAAAEELFLTPSAVSRSIQVLEDWLGCQLFVRGNRSIALTANGTDYARRVRAALDGLADATAAVPGSRGPARLSISCAPTFGLKWLMLRLGRFRAEHPDIAVSVDTAHRQVDIPREEVDLAIRLGAGPWGELASLHLAAESLAPVCAPALAARIAGPADLAALPLVHVSSVSRDWAYWADVRGIAELPLEGGLRFDTVQFALDAAAQGLGVALGRRPLVDADLESGALVELLGPPVPSGNGYWLLWQPAAESRPELRAFLNWIRLELAAESATAAPASSAAQD